MTDAPRGTIAETIEKPPVEFFAALERNLPRMPGRRAWVEYFDYGVTDATHGRMRAQRAMAKGQTEGTGWHYHICEMQFIYLLGGGVTMQFEDGSVLRLERGDSALIPGGYKHNELDISEDFDVLEVTVPAVIETRPCDIPEAWRVPAEA
ncbi:cupin domain-containing protein [Sphingomonas naphthae]|uniref:Cupin domain-containing protein n=1 Tax=Sphingomonas naphthae TaxID=1813468 RepID=A0ABY7TND3_9SPHN|nr:cupin domain-containing protein [Sphingomonas naphthae]WCT74528.1 cupin domain-containing protein [Sphingomonas naphthae]